MKTNLHICKHEHEKNMTRLWCKIMLKIGVEHNEGNEGSYFYLYPFGGFNSRKLPRKLICEDQVIIFFKNLFNQESTMN